MWGIKRLWGSLSHQLTYNTSIEFNTDAEKYVWVRRGIEVLLDKAESNENSIDAIWTAATFIGWKIGASDEEAGLRKLFADDIALHDRISKHVDLKTCVDQNGELDCMLVANGIYERCNQRVDGSEEVKSKIGNLERAAKPIIMLNGRARWFDRKLQFEAANQQWEQVLEAWQRLGEQVVEPQDVWYQVRENAIQFRLSTDGKAIGKPIAKANAFRVEGDYDSELVEAKLALKKIRQILNQAPEHSESVDWLFGDFLLAGERRYQKLDEAFSKEMRDLCEEFGLVGPYGGFVK